MTTKAFPKPISALTIAVMKAVSSSAGLWARMIGGSLVIAGSILSGGWSLLFIPLGAVIITTGLLNLCPASLFYRKSLNGENFLISFDQIDSKNIGLK